MKKYLISILLLCAFSLSVAEANENYTSIKSPYPIAKTLDRLEKILKSKGIRVFARIDHGAGARKVGKLLHPSQLLIFGNPRMGSPLMNEAPMMGLELPMKALVWEDDRGQIWLSYLNPSVLQQRHGLNNKKIIKKMTEALNVVTHKAVAKD